MASVLASFSNDCERHRKGLTHVTTGSRCLDIDLMALAVGVTIPGGSGASDLIGA
jgi:hypothetical protein